MKEVNISEIIELIYSKREGSYWDFKCEWHSKKADLLHDIICMANNIEFRKAYIFIGVDNDFQICGVDSDENRKNTQNLVDFLRDKKFAGGFRPTVKVDAINIENKTIDVLTIYSDYNTPYYLMEDYKDNGVVYANNIYTRIQDTNTPKNKSADIHHVEKLWRRRFGLDMSIKEKYLFLLDQDDEWELHFGDMRATYHKNFPEFQIEVDYDESHEGWEPQSPFYPDPKMLFTPIRLMYHNTIIFQTGIIACDGHRIYLPYSDENILRITISDTLIKRIDGVHYYYYTLSKLSGKLFKLMTSGELNFSSRGINSGVNLYLIFENDDEHNRFIEFASENYERIDTSLIRKRHKYSLEQKYEGNPMEYRILTLLIASELYNLWREDSASDLFALST